MAARQAGLKLPPQLLPYSPAMVTLGVRILERADRIKDRFSKVRLLKEMEPFCQKVSAQAFETAVEFAFAVCKKILTSYQPNYQASL